ncbi:MAG: (d)CMP kinase [Gammaproteobacteria bacterium]|nr:MAG: (d)CMP kinase [Gammaproteobacteria bacterium]
MTENSIPVITIDGPAGSGKGTIARQVASTLKYHYLDSGAMYRVLSLLSQQKEIEVDDIQGLVSLCAEMNVRFGFDAQNMSAQTQANDQQENVPVFLNEYEVSGELRTEDCASRASELASLQQVRAALLEKQHSFRQLPGLVAEGRDMGTVVFPDAERKIFLTASPHERALRRQKQLKKQGISASLGPLLKEIETRDSRDQNRNVSPLRPADDALLVDSTNLSIQQAVDRIAEIVRGGH